MILPPVAPVEAAMAVIGLRTIVSKKVERVRRAELDRIDGIAKEVARLARNLVNDELTETFYSDLDYRAMLNDLAHGFDLDQVQKMTDHFPGEFRDLGLALTLQSTQVIEALMAMVPTSVYQTITGPRSLVPSDVAVWKFVSILEVLDDPMLIFPLMNTGALLRSQATAVRTLYPTLSAAVDAALFDATVKAKARKRSFELAPRAEVGVQAWISTSPTASPEIAAQRKARLQSAQAVVAKVKVNNEQRMAAAAAAKKDAGLDETPAQRDPARPT